MISIKKLIKMAKKWQRLAKASRKRISWSITNKSSTGAAAAAAVEKGCFVVYTTDEARFALPLKYLESKVLIELLRLGEEELGLITSDGPITLPCDSSFMNYVVSMLRRCAATAEIEDALVLFMRDCGTSSSSAALMSVRHEQLPIGCC